MQFLFSDVKSFKNNYKNIFTLNVQNGHLTRGAIHGMAPEKKSTGLRSGEFGGHGISVLLEITAESTDFFSGAIQ